MCSVCAIVCNRRETWRKIPVTHPFLPAANKVAHLSLQTHCEIQLATFAAAWFAEAAAAVCHPCRSLPRSDGWSQRADPYQVAVQIVSKKHRQIRQHGRCIDILLEWMEGVESTAAALKCLLHHVFLCSSSHSLMNTRGTTWMSYYAELGHS